MRAVGAERVDRGIELALDRSRCRLLVDIIDGAADRAETRHDRRRSLEDFDLLETGRVHDPRGDALRTDPDAIVENGDFAAGKAPHREAGERAARIAGEHADCAGRDLGRGAIALFPHGVLADNLDAGRRLMRGKAEPAGTAGDNVAVERHRRGLCDRDRLCRWIPRGVLHTFRRGLLRAALAGRSLRLRRRHHDRPECR